jgi:hypothetical protein
LKTTSAADALGTIKYAQPDSNVTAIALSTPDLVFIVAPAPYLVFRPDPPFSGLIDFCGAYRCNKAPDGLLLPWIAVWQFWHERANDSTAFGPLNTDP